MINGPSVYDSGASAPFGLILKPFLIGQHQQKSLKSYTAREGRINRGHPNHTQRDHLSFFTVENQFLEGNRLYFVNLKVIHPLNILNKILVEVGQTGSNGY